MPLPDIGIFGFGNAIKYMVSDTYVVQYYSGVFLTINTIQAKFTTGEAVRFKPDGVLFSTPEAFRVIHHPRSNVKKGRFYQIWPRNSKYNDVFSMIDKSQHSKRRRVLNQAFSEKAVRAAEPFIVKHIDRWNKILLKRANAAEWTASQNMSDLAGFIIFDIGCDLLFGKSFDIKEPQDNHLKETPHAIAKYLQAMYPVRNCG